MNQIIPSQLWAAQGTGPGVHSLSGPIARQRSFSKEQFSGKEGTSLRQTLRCAPWLSFGGLPWAPYRIPIYHGNIKCYWICWVIRPMQQYSLCRISLESISWTSCKAFFYLVTMHIWLHCGLYTKLVRGPHSNVPYVVSKIQRAIT